MSKQIEVRPQPGEPNRPRTWGVYSDGILVEGGFFDKVYALECAKKLMALIAPAATTLKIESQP